MNRELRMKKDIAKILLVAAVLSVFFAARRSEALGGDFSIDFTPKSYEPGQEISASIKTFTFDPDRVEITWQVDGKTAAKGVGEKKIKITAPELGKEKKIDAYISLSNGAKILRSATLVGSDIDLLWEAVSYSPSWYKGRTLAVAESSIKITAVPHLYSGGKEISGSNLVYEWFVNYSKDESNSGAGKNSFAFNLSRRKDYVVSARVSNFDKSVSLEKLITFPLNAAKPKIVFYEDDLLEGAKYNKALKDGVSFGEEEIILRAEPFFFSSGVSGGSSYKWMISGKAATPGDFPNILPLRAGGGSGSANISLKINNPAKVFQSVQKSLNINYGQ